MLVPCLNGVYRSSMSFHSVKVSQQRESVRWGEGGEEWEGNGIDWAILFPDLYSPFLSSLSSIHLLSLHGRSTHPQPAFVLQRSRAFFFISRWKTFLSPMSGCQRAGCSSSSRLPVMALCIAWIEAFSFSAEQWDKRERAWNCSLFSRCYVIKKKKCI